MGKSVILAGGLGNNLFQLAAAVFKFGVHQFDLELLMSSTQSSLQDFKMGNDAIFVRRLKRFTLKQRVLNYSLRISANADRTVLNVGRRAILKLFLVLLQRKVSFINFGIGLSSGLEKTRAKFLIGYFQTQKYASVQTVYQSLMSLEIRNPSTKYRLIENEVSRARPIVIHVRRGDYVNSGFGLLGKEYYCAALPVLGTPRNQEVWVFSDETNQIDLRGLLPDGYSYRFILGNELSDSETFQVMRHGSAFVIANSTFSWWAAFLRHDIESPVVAPKDWFYNSPSPLYLIPNDWNLVDSLFTPEKGSV